ncbi:MAG TPA: hypothetical protein VGM91_10380 [Conexibacter sp.]|jgi:hypothetical protein
MRHATVVAAAALADLALLAWLASAPAADIYVGQYSGQRGTGRAEIGGSVTEHESVPSGPGTSGGNGSPSADGPPSYTPTETTEPSAPTAGSEVPLVDPRFRGARSREAFDPIPSPCLYFPNTPGGCPIEPSAAEPPRGRRARAPPIDPGAVAASIAVSMPLLPGEITVNPEAAGWTGVASWFWLEPAPRTVAAVAVLGAEQIVVTAQPYPMWSFGDGAQAGGSVGRPYRRGADVQGAVRHRYETRCMPGDAGRNPHVSESCTGDGYAVGAAVEWSISFVATGLVEMSGALPSRTTTTSNTYPVNEVRAFLTEGAS